LSKSATIWHFAPVPAPDVTPPARPEDPPSTSRLDSVLGAVAAALPFLVALSRASAGGQWRADASAIRDLGFVAIGLGGGASTFVTQALALLPLGSRSLRAALGSALALGLAAWLVYRLALRAVRALEPSQRLAPVLATIAALTAALSPTWQREATLGGSAMLATALGLGTVALALACVDRRASRVARGASSTWIALGALLGAALAESVAAGLAASLAVTAIFAAERFAPNREPRGALVLWPTRRVVAWSALACTVMAALVLAPLALRPLAPRGWTDFGQVFSMGRLSPFEHGDAALSALGAWRSEVGLVSLAVAAFGAASALWTRAGRRHVAPWLALVLIDRLAPPSAVQLLSAGTTSPLRPLALAAIAVGSALGVHAVVVTLLRSRLPFVRPTSVLVVTFHLMFVALVSEDSARAADRTEQYAAEEWTDQALGVLEPRSAIFVRSPALALRLWSARATRGERPDVLVVPAPLLRRARVARDLAEAEPATMPLLRDFALSGEPGEFALSTLADLRPLHIELDNAWPKRLASHLSADGLWLEYAPEPLGASDRPQTAAKLAPIRRVLAAVSVSALPDEPTQAILVDTLTAQASVLTLLGQPDVAETLIQRVADLTRDDPFLQEGWLHAAFAAITPPSTEKTSKR
jgi:hypothetical protein